MNPKVPKPAQDILNFLAGFESKGNYLAYFGHSDNRNRLPATCGAVLAWMKDCTQHHHSPSSATGRYQLMNKTLTALMKTHNISPATPFTPDLQDLLAYYLLEERGYSAWVGERLTTQSFADHLSMEWASLPYHTGKSYYDGDGLNHSLVSRQHFIAMLVKAKEEQEVA